MRLTSPYKDSLTAENVLVNIQAVRLSLFLESIYFSAISSSQADKGGGKKCKSRLRAFEFVTLKLFQISDFVVSAQSNDFSLRVL
jgi:hypothetical protein